MSGGLYIKQQRQIRYGVLLFWLIFFGLCAATMWYGWRYYSEGELPPVPVPLATARADVDESPVEPTQKSEHRAQPNHPRLMTISSMGIDNARVFPVGITGNNEVATPVNIFDIGWYDQSGLPGVDNQTVLLDGHNGGPTKDGVFKRLPGLQTGSLIMIERGDGQKLNYIVEEVKNISLDDMNNGGMQEALNPVKSGTQGLTLISCTGRWVPALNTYDQRVVVRAYQVK